MQLRRTLPGGPTGLKQQTAIKPGVKAHIPAETRGRRDDGANETKKRISKRGSNCNAKVS